MTYSNIILINIEYINIIIYIWNLNIDICSAEAVLERILYTSSSKVRDSQTGLIIMSKVRAKGHAHEESTS